MRKRIVRHSVAAVLGLCGLAAVLMMIPVSRHCGHTTRLGVRYGPLAVTHCCRSGRRLVGMRRVRSALERYRGDRGTYPSSVQELTRARYVFPGDTEGLEYRRVAGSYTLLSLDQGDGAISYLMQADGIVFYGMDGVVTSDSPRLTAEASNPRMEPDAARPSDGEGRETD